jgi:hypothetical protein
MALLKPTGRFEILSAPKFIAATRAADADIVCAVPSVIEVRCSSFWIKVKVTRFCIVLFFVSRLRCMVGYTYRHCEFRFLLVRVPPPYNHCARATVEDLSTLPSETHLQLLVFLSTVVMERECLSWSSIYLDS